MTKVEELLRKQRELAAKMVEVQDDKAKFEALEREYNANRREIEIENQKAVAIANAPKREVSKDVAFLSVVREAKKGGTREFVLKREASAISSAVVGSGDVANIESAGMPVTLKDILLPLEMETIYGKVGIQIATGVKGALIWPVLDSAAEVQIAGETVALDDKTLDFSKIQAAPQRLGISISVSNEALNDASFDLQGLVVNQINAALARVINKAVVGGTAVGTLSGPFAGTNSKRVAVTFAGSTPTYAELLSMKGQIAGKGAQMKAFAYVMNPTTYAELEGTTAGAGGGRMIIEDGKIGGYPVFQTDSAKVADGTVYAGDFAYVALNQHGDTYFIIDPYTAAKKNETVFTLNSDWSLTVLKPECFAIGKAGA